MPINTKFQTMTIDSEKNLTPKQIVVQCNMDTSSKGGVKSVCFLTTDVLITKAQALTKQVKASGQVNIKVMYFDGENKPESFDYISDFVEDIVDEGVVDQMPVRVSGYVVDNDYEIEDDHIKIQVVIELQPVVIESREINWIVEADNALVQTTDLEIQKFLGLVNEQTEVAHEYDSGVNVDKILYFDNQATIENVSESDKILKAIGNVNSVIVYQSGDEICQKHLNIPFEHEWRVEDGDIVLCPICNVKASKLIIQGDENANVLRCEVLVDIGGSMFVQSKQEIVSDLFCPSQLVELSKEELEYNIIKESCQSISQVVGNTIIDMSKEDIKQIQAIVPLYASVAGVVCKQENCQVDGLVVVGVVYVDEKQNSQCLKVDLPFSSMIECDIKDTTMITSSVSVLDVASKVKRDREIEITVDICVRLCLREDVKERGIVSVELGEDRVAPSSAITIYITHKGESLWDIAKMLGMSEKEILKQNPTVEKILQGGEKLVIYREKNMC